MSHGGGEIVHVGVVAAVVGGVDPTHPTVARLLAQISSSTEHLSRRADAERKLLREGFSNISSVN